MPPCLHVAEDQARFRTALAAADVTILGREGHERHPAQGRARLVLTSSVEAVAFDADDDKIARWNPVGATLADALAAFGEGNERKRTAVIAGGTRVMTELLPVTDRFDLVVAPDCRIVGGRACLVGTRSVPEIEDRLRSAGLARTRVASLGPARLMIWNRSP